ncbi:hypothetical protein Q4574_09700 [Aliiglaciecola sp. 3_MG-2023]|uniref:hypothetical protein n=1 Tax=Aliiglaciecola sp. 3_MG-2023 TaxID=3062644 RepID=UPI0026E41FC7|nr:hypothetical protein [Aliiglaciecola sp. 3_MG-2023]MDO6693558.1 hypothetical protein [Aliiglaciecola sp. 3_MG-2023]
MDNLVTEVASLNQTLRSLESEEQPDDKVILTIAAAMLLAGIIHDEEVKNVCLPAEEELEELGLLLWCIESQISQDRFSFDNLNEYESFYDKIYSPHFSDTEFYRILNGVLASAISQKSVFASSQLVALGLRSPNNLIRSCALCSAIDLFDIKELDLFQRIGWFYGREVDETTSQILASIVSRVFLHIPSANNQTPFSITPSPSNVPNLLLIHGTVLPTKQSNAPTWSVPNTGQLHNHLRSIRPDVYSQNDYFRWEGGYTDYAREVASMNLNDWINARNLSGLDIIAHSHGCNVVMDALKNGTNIRNIIFLNCPVHWQKYSLHPLKFKDVNSIRIKFDFVILADRGKQRFPKNTVTETILPFWFTSHSAATKLKVWKSQNLDRFI